MTLFIANCVSCGPQIYHLALQFPSALQSVLAPFSLVFTIEVHSHCYLKHTVVFLALHPNGPKTGKCRELLLIQEVLSLL